jgi:hypothetical protein
VPALAKAPDNINKESTFEFLSRQIPNHGDSGYRNGWHRLALNRKPIKVSISVTKAQPKEAKI